ncbi:MAG: porin, partial [Bacteroidaceae bacterium]|nr:porin [Bacteroidaceae bacterium]
MKKNIFSFIGILFGMNSAMAQYEADTENGVVSLAGRNGFTIETKKGDFVFKPYLLVQTAANYRWYDDEGLDKAYNQDNVANSGFSVPYAVLGFTGKAFGKVSFNLSINAAASGGALLQQAWFDVAFKKELALRVGKFKTPFSHAYLTTLGETLMPALPTSLTSAVILPHSLNAVTPNIGTGFDLGVELHGLLGGKWGYEVGLFNGTGASVNSAGKTLSDDWHIPSLLYAGRFSFMPKGVMPSTQGNPNRLNEDKWLLAVSTSMNVE